MSHEVSYPITPLEQLSLEEQIDYIEAHQDEIIAEIRADETMPQWEKEWLVDLTRRARSEFEGAIDLEEFMKEFMKD